MLLFNRWKCVLIQSFIYLREVLRCDITIEGLGIISIAMKRHPPSVDDMSKDGLRTDPCGTPQVTESDLDLHPPSETYSETT